jgi:hypothetical protein
MLPIVPVVPQTTRSDPWKVHPGYATNFCCNISWPAHGLVATVHVQASFNHSLMASCAVQLAVGVFAQVDCS